MPTIMDDWIANRRLASLLRAELAIAHAASHLAEAVSSLTARRAADAAAHSAWRSSEVLSGMLPRTFRRAAPRSLLADLLAASYRLGDRVAIFALGCALRLQERRFRQALDMLDPRAQEAIVRGVLVHRVATISSMRDDGASANELETSPP